MKNILLVFGGVSYEHDISIVTAFQILNKTKLDGYKLILFYISRDGRFYVCDEKLVNICDFSKQKFDGKKKGFKEVVFVSGEKQKLFLKTRFGLKEFMSSEVAIFACHGGDGENGRMVTLFENMGFACSAGSSEALAICMDKFLFKSVSKGLKIPVVAGFKLSKQEFFNGNFDLSRRLNMLKFPVIIKINSGGSSIGLFTAMDEDDFKDKAIQAFEFNDDIVVEKFINNAREFNVAILGDGEKYEISPIDEPIKNNDVLTFADKYLSSNSGKSGVKSEDGAMNSSLRKTPIDLSCDVIERIEKLAKKIFVKLGLYGVVRIDFLFDENNNKIYVCEVNSIPGSLAFYLFKKNLIVTNDLIEKLINIAIKNFGKKQIKTDFIVNVLDEK